MGQCQVKKLFHYSVPEVEEREKGTENLYEEMIESYPEFGGRNRNPNLGSPENYK